MVWQRISITTGLAFAIGALSSCAFSQSVKKSYEFLPTSNTAPALFAEGTQARSRYFLREKF
jgi:hypothetical protein